MKTILLITAIFASVLIHAQKGDELVVYSLTGNVSVVENNTESKVKVGKVLKPGTTIKTQRLAKITLVCKQGKPITVVKEGSFPVEKWKDSCATNNNSMTTKYFQFIWDQLYVRSDEYKKEHPDDMGLTTAAPVRGEEELEIILNQWVDTIYYAVGNFPLNWITNKDYDGKYYFSLYNLKTKKRLFFDSLSGNSVDISRIKKFMRQGNSYSWKVSVSKKDEGQGGIIKYVSTSAVSSQVNKLKKLVYVPEDPAAESFRLAYLLQETGYTPEAFVYYQKAARSAPGISLYSEKLEEFKKEFGFVK